MNDFFEYKPHQIKIIKDVRRLDLSNLFYLVIQQNEKLPNYTLNELKRHIRRGVKEYAKNYFGYKYKAGLENDIISYYTFFETSKDFNLSQLKNTIVNEDEKMNLHFHLFISSNQKMICIHQVITDILFSFFSQKLKAKSLKKIDYKKIDKIEDNFILYHTKQHQNQIIRELVLTNLD